MNFVSASQVSSTPQHSATTAQPSGDDPTAIADLVAKLQTFSDEFDERCQERHTMGEKKYGTGTWMNVDTLEMAIDEVIDLANYARFTFIRLRQLQETLGTDKSVEKALPGNEMMGKPAGFMSYRKD